MIEVIGKNYSLTAIKIYCRLVGFFPYDLIERGEKISVKISLKYLIWSYFLGTSLILTGTLCVFWSLIFLRQWFSPIYIHEVMVIYCVHVNFMFNIVGAFICIIYFSFSRKKLNTLIHNILKADKLLDNLEIPIRKNRWSKLMASFIVAAIVIVVIADSISYYLILEENQFIMHFSRKLPYFSSYLFSLSQTYIFWSLVLLVRARIYAIKKDIAKFDGISILENKILAKEFESVLHHQTKKGKSNLKHLQIVYIYLYDAAKALDELMRPIIVLMFVTRFFSLLITPFMLYIQITGYGSTVFISSQTCWVLVHFFSLALIVEPASCCRKEYEKLKQELSRFICHANIFNEDLELLFDLVKALPIEFYINDATPLKRTLYVSILGSLTTYLVVLFQMANTK